MIPRSLSAAIVCLSFVMGGDFASGEDFVPGQNLTLPSVISTVTQKEDWPVLRGRIRDKIFATWGTCPVEFSPAVNVYKEVSRYEKHGLNFIVYKYQVCEDCWQRAILVLPPGYDKDKKYPLVLAVHGTNGPAGAQGMIDPEKFPHRIYGLELAKKGYLVLCPDQFGFGDDLNGTTQAAVFADFAAKYPKWSITGRQILGLIRALDFASQLPSVDLTKGAGEIGHSLGGKCTMFHMAFDQRVSVAVASAAISPMISNTYRGLNKRRADQPLYWDEVEKHGHYIWDENEIIALCAPRPLMIIDPANDPYTPSIDFDVQAVLSALPVWRLLGKPENLNLFVHGDGHDTTDEVRAFAYTWLDRFLVKKPEK